jgi:hypothetical protein
MASSKNAPSFDPAGWQAANCRCAEFQFFPAPSQFADSAKRDVSANAT